MGREAARGSGSSAHCGVLHASGFAPAASSVLHTAALPAVAACEGAGPQRAAQLLLRSCFSRTHQVHSLKAASQSSDEHM